MYEGGLRLLQLAAARVLDLVEVLILALGLFWEGEIGVSSSSVFSDNEPDIIWNK